MSRSVRRWVIGGRVCFLVVVARARRAGAEWGVEFGAERRRWADRPSGADVSQCA